MKCQKCAKAATLHITEVITEDQFEELHLCEECANKYLYEPQQKTAVKTGEVPAEEGEETSALNQRERFSGRSRPRASLTWCGAVE